MVKKSFLFIIAALASATLVMAQKSTPAQVTCGPYVQCMSTSGFTVTWTTDVDAVAWVEVAPDDGTHFYAKERKKFYDRRGCGVLPIGRIHKIEIDGLEPGTNYRYRIMSKGVVSYERPGKIEYLRTRGSDVYSRKPYKISTLKEEYDTVRFNIYNDIHGADSLLNVLLSGSRNDPDFIFLNGDMTSNINDHNMINELYLRTIARNLKGETPLFMSRGNHEYRGKDAVRWFDYFQTPTGASYYAFSMGKFFFLVLDAGEDKPDSDIEYCGIAACEPYLELQEKWLKEALASDECVNAQVRIAFCHMPPEQKGWRGNIRSCERLVPHLNDAGIDAMFCGHIHRWRVAEPDGVLSNAEFPVICNPKVQRMEVTVTEKDIHIRTVNTDGVMTDSHSLKL